MVVNLPGQIGIVFVGGFQHDLVATVSQDTLKTSVSSVYATHLRAVGELVRGEVDFPKASLPY